MPQLLTPEVFVGVVVAVIGVLGSVLVAKLNGRQARESENTKRLELLIVGQGSEIERLNKEVADLRDEFKKEQQLTETLKEESSKWRGLLQTALEYLRRLHNWQVMELPPPPPPMPEELIGFLWEEI